MGSPTILDLDDQVIAAPKAEARANDRSMEAEARRAPTERFDRIQRMVEFRKRMDALRRLTEGIPQTDSVELLREDRNR